MNTIIKSKSIKKKASSDLIVYKTVLNRQLNNNHKVK
jgi:hypothetical protein